MCGNQGDKVCREVVSLIKPNGLKEMEKILGIHHSSQFSVPAAMSCVRNRVETGDLEAEVFTSAEQALGNKESDE